MQIIPDPIVVALQLVPFLLTIFVLHAIIFKPMLEYLDDREKAQSGGKDEADALRSRIEEKTSDYEGRLAAARNEVIDLRADRRGAASQEAEARLAAARKQADAKVEAALAQIGQERAAASAGLEAASRELADDIAGQVLGRSLKAG